MFTQLIIQKQNTDGQRVVQLTLGQMDRHRDVQHETVIPHHYRVARYKKGLQRQFLLFLHQKHILGAY